MTDVEELQEILSRLERKELLKRASRIAGFKLRKGIEYASAANVSGVRDQSVSFSRRLDSRTLFAQDSAYGTTKKAGVWTGHDKPLVTACTRAMKAAGVPGREIASIRVVSEFGVTAQRLADGKPRISEQKLLRKEARARRVVDGFPVWSSFAVLGLTSNGRLGRLEIHWPDLPNAVVKEAAVLRTIVKRGFKPPALPGVKVEAVDVGIIHSSAIGFFMDVNAVIRVVYIGDDPSIGRKPTLYLDRHGQSIELPRDIKETPRDTKQRATPTRSQY
jgi:hypothetical protein